MADKKRDRKLKFRPRITRIKLNPEQAVLTCDCYSNGWIPWVGIPPVGPYVVVCTNFPFRVAMQDNGIPNANVS